jgi:hypothetical protein
MPSSGYTAITFVANEQPTTAKWNLIGSNDSSFNLGTGLEDNVILDRHILTGNLKATKFANSVKFSVKRTTAQTPAGGAILFNTVAFDTGSNYNTVNGRFTAPAAGFYQINASAQWAVSAAPQDPQTTLMVNGAQLIAMHFVNMYNNVSTGSAAFGILLQLAANDYVQVAGPSLAIDTGNNNFSGFLVSAT